MKLRGGVRMSIICTLCETTNIDGALFCDECGGSLEDNVETQENAITCLKSEAPEILESSVIGEHWEKGEAATIICSSCNHTNPSDSQFCEECGANISPLPSTVPPVSNEISQGIEIMEEELQNSSIIAKLLIADGGDELPLDFTEKNELVVGRSDPVSDVYPEIDLTPYGAFEGGVSRQHCTLIMQGNKVGIKDLESTNGTKVNDKQVRGETCILLNEGDVIKLGQTIMTFLTVL